MAMLCAAPWNRDTSPARLSMCSRRNLPPPASRCWLSKTFSPRRTSAGRLKKRRKLSACASWSKSSNTFRHGVALNAVNVPAMTAEQYRAVGPYIDLAERLGNLRRVCCDWQPKFGSPGLSRQDRGTEYRSGPQCGACRCAEPFAGPKGQRGERSPVRLRSRPDLRRTTREAVFTHRLRAAGIGHRHGHNQ